MNSGVGQGFWGEHPSTEHCPGVCNAPPNPLQEMINCWQSLIELSPVWTDLPDVKVSLLLIVANIHKLRSPDFSGVTPPWGGGCG